MRCNGPHSIRTLRVLRACVVMEEGLGVGEACRHVG